MILCILIAAIVLPLCGMWIYQRGIRDGFDIALESLPRPELPPEVLERLKGPLA